MPELYEVHTKGEPNQYFEICVIRKDFEHGYKSYGWFDKIKKIYISDSGCHCHNTVDEFTWALLIGAASLVCDRLNHNPPQETE